MTRPASAARVLVGFDRVRVVRGTTVLLDDVTLGVTATDRLGVLGRNGAGKTTLVRTLAGLDPPQGGRVSAARDLRVGLLDQQDRLDPAARVLDVLVVPGTPEHVWRGDAGIRDVMAGLGAEPLLDRTVGTLSGGERRRVALAALLVADLDLLLLDEPTNHLDMDAVAWLAGHLTSPAARHGGLVAVTHDRWFLDEVATQVWEVGDGQVRSYSGGYSAYVLARAERVRRAEATQARQANLLRKELAWLRRGAPARTRKPRYRVEAATALVEGEPPPRDSLALRRFATARLGRTVLELHDASLRRGDRVLLDAVTWRLGPGERVGLIGANGAGKTTLLRALAGQEELDAGRLVTGTTVRLAYLSQDVAELPGRLRALEAVEQVARVLDTGREELTASQLLERFGVPPARQWTPVAELSGGERRRLQMLRLLMDGPNVLLLDEPTNDLDVDTLLGVEDVLDSWPGTLVVVSHDRWFLERVCDTVVALPGDGSLRSLPGGVEEFLRSRALPGGTGAAPGSGTTRGSGTAPRPGAPEVPARAAQRRAGSRELARLQRLLARLQERQAQLHRELAAAATDYLRVVELDRELSGVVAELAAAEDAWLELSQLLEG